MIKKSNTQLVIVLLLTGLIAYTTLYYLKEFLSVWIVLIAVLLKLSYWTIFYLDLIPAILIMLLWAYLVFFRLTNIPRTFEVNLDSLSKGAFRFAKFCLVIIVASILSSLFSTHIQFGGTLQIEPFVVKHNDQGHQAILMSIIRFSEFVILVIGFYKIFGKFTVANNT